MPIEENDRVPKLGSLLPAFGGVPRWRGGAAPTEADLAGMPVLVHFFSSGCPLCREGMPILRRLRDAHAPAGVVVIGAFQPRPDVEATIADAERVCDLIVHDAHRSAADVEGVLAARFGHRWAPAYYVYDRAHRLRHFQVGNWNLDALAGVLEGIV